ncbi:ATP-dependent sacrificial sulfur transferase LarE [Paramaledivibacter caminithermalis]|jgi:uncharacterized protein|uniref:NAD/GMP synthase domain-containing protein n=1 Tax=Paramaledivibacter caminithermalis (strain DSM 15212 / CIP 107654 / DViRD3) TaxID=1121301 RepID=A0A1M6LWH9_PARC5|nr:ATP-dependent sacrificial sulfur transferase LarE [Paramaledivibacter caminithermalis]SHJ75604.1 uncharacterized protein SAMN02745912_00950 [Paramaledivibacter caminithermalis DSM 15212]
MINNVKYMNLINYLKDLKSVLIAFSGGVDSTFLLQACKEALGDNVKAITINSPYIPKWEIEEAKELAKKIGVEHEIIEIHINDQIKNNPINRCYLCKKFIFSTIKDIAQKQGYNHVIDGTNFDDTKDYRPGLVALDELEIKSPMLDIELTKEEIRSLSKKLGLKTWDKPAYACLLTRIPYETELKITDLNMIEKAEKYMMDIGFRAIRVRKHSDLARVEVNREDRKRLFNENVLDDISKKFKELGFKYITMDLEGYRIGSFNDKVNKP